MSHAKKNPHSHRGGDLTIEEVLASPVLVAPFREMDVPGTSDGAVAVLLADADTAKDLTDTPVFVRGVGWSADGYFLGDRDLLEGSLPKAAEMAYKMAGVEDPSKEIDVAELCDLSSFQEIICTEQLGFCEPGKGGTLVEDGVTAIDGRLPVNPSGGLFGANPYVARGLIRVAEAALQVKGEAGDHQVGDVRRALAQSVHGLGGQSNSVVILGN
jgi:acetyl-CoA C-acetyltransferase